MQMPLDDQSDVSDDALLVLYANGDPNAARVLMARLLPRVLAHAHRLLGNTAEAEDVVQEAMLRLWRIAPEWRQGEAKITTWLYRVTANLCTDRMRRQRAGAPLETAEDIKDEAAGPLEKLQQDRRAQALQSALLNLPDRQRQAVVLRHLEEKSNPEIAEIMEISVEAAESLITRGKRALAAHLSEKREALGYSDDH